MIIQWTYSTVAPNPWGMTVWNWIKGEEAIVDTVDGFASAQAGTVYLPGMRVGTVYSPGAKQGQAVNG